MTSGISWCILLGELNAVSGVEEAVADMLWWVVLVIILYITVYIIIYLYYTYVYMQDDVWCYVLFFPSLPQMVVGTVPPEPFLETTTT